MSEPTNYSDGRLALGTKNPNPAPDRIMTDEQLQQLHDDIRDGVSMIVEKKHYYEMESELKRLRKEKE